MIKILWVQLCCVHDHLNPVSGQVRHMIAALKQRGAELAVLSSTIRTSTNPNTVAQNVREQIQHSTTKFHLLEDDIPYVYTTTASNNLGDMTVLEQRNFYNEMTPIICGFKPDLVIASSSDIVTMSCLNLAKQCGLPTAFVLLEHPTFEYSFRDSDLIVATSQFLIDSYVTPQGRSATYLGPFIKLSGPLLTKAHETGATSTTAQAKRAQLKNMAAEIASRKLILLVNPSLENGLALYLELVKRCRADRTLFSYQFAVLEREPNQFVSSLNEYYDADSGQKSYDLNHFHYLKVYPYTTNLHELLSQTRALVMPTLSYDCTPEVSLEAISHGVSVITTDQPTLQEFLGPQACYLDVDQEVIDHLTTPPQAHEVEPWYEALKAQINSSINLKALKLLFEQNSFECSCKRLALALKPLTDQHAGDRPQILRSGAFSLRAIIRAELDAQEQAAHAAAVEQVAHLSDDDEELDANSIFYTPNLDTARASVQVATELRRSLMDANVLAGNEYIAQLVEGKVPPSAPDSPELKLQEALVQANANAASSYLTLAEAAKRAFSTAQDQQKIFTQTKLGQALAEILRQPKL